MANLSTYLANKLLDHSLGDVAYAKPTAYLALFTTAPSMPAGTGGVEVTGGSYARIPLAGDWAAAASGAKTTNAIVTFALATADWGLLTSTAVMDALTVGNLLWEMALAEAKNVYNGDTFQFNIAQLNFALA